MCSSDLNGWLPLALAITVVSALVYVAVQQNYRASANDPQVQLAEDLTQTLNGGVDPASLLSNQKTEMGQSLSPFLIVYDENGKVLASSVQLAEEVSAPPSGVFAYTKTHGENRVTWQPKPGVRNAAVLTYYKSSQASGFILVGRSLREVETRELDLLKVVGTAWALTLAVTLLAHYLFLYKSAVRGQS